MPSTVILHVLCFVLWVRLWAVNTDDCCLDTACEVRMEFSVLLAPIVLYTDSVAVSQRFIVFNY